MYPNAQVHSSGNIIEVVYRSSVLSPKRVRKGTLDALALHQETGITNVLLDGRSTLLFESLKSVSDLPKLYEELDVPEDTRFAVVEPTTPSALRAAQLYARVCSEAGWDVNLFDTRSGAIDWLLSD